MSKYPQRKSIEHRLLDPAQFIEHLQQCKSPAATTIALTQKRLAPDNDTDNTYTILFRATDRKTFKISTQVPSDALAQFIERYTETCRSLMGAGLKKRDRKKDTRKGKK